MIPVLPDAGGHFGPYGGRYVPETLMTPLDEIEKAYLAARQDPAFEAELGDLLRNYAGRPTPLYFARRLSESLGGARIYLKREDLLHTGAHKINNCLGQVLLARRMGKRRVIAETGAGQHGVATATVCALFGLECTVYMGEEDMRRQSLNVFRMRMLGARVESVSSGSRTLKDAISEAMRDWVTNVSTTYYLLGSALGTHPYPLIVRDFQSVIGEEARAQILQAEGRLPDTIFACVGGGSNAIGIFHRFILDRDVRLIGIEAGGRGPALGEHAARFSGGSPGVLHGAYSYLLQDADGQVSLTHSVSAGLDYALVGPEHAWLHDQGRAEYVAIGDAGALEAAKTLSRTEGIIPALEAAHAVAEVIHRAPQAKGKLFLVSLSGRGDKDIDIYRENFPDSIPASSGTRIARLFARLRQEGRKGFIGYITAGDPALERTPALAAALERGGVDLIELGVPFSDPIADGPVIQRASERALRAGASLRRILDLTREIRAHSEVPLLLFTYLNPVLRYGLEALARDAAAASIDGLLLTDLSVEEAAAYVDLMRRHSLDTVFLAAPTSTEERLRLVAKYSSGFVYLVSRTGVTGERDSVPGSVAPLARAMRRVTDLPLAVGFGISRPEHVAEIGGLADAVVVGSAFVRLIEQSAGNASLEVQLEALARELKHGFDLRK